MSIVNRSLDGSEQVQDFTGRITGVVTGASYGVLIAPFPCQLVAAKFAAYGLSGSPQVKLHNQRWLAAGQTQIELGVSNVVFAVATGISGAAQGWSGIGTRGSTLLDIQEGDVIQVETAGANTGADEVLVTLSLKKLQDVVTHLGYDASGS